MQIKYVTVSLFTALAAAQSNSTSLADLVAQLPTCASSCLESGASSAGCDATDFSCLCGTGKSSFITSAGVCIATSGSCSSDEQQEVQTLAGEICSEASSANSSELSSASAVATSILATATGASATSTTGSNVAAATAVGYGLMGGAAALAAFAL